MFEHGWVAHLSASDPPGTPSNNADFESCLNESSNEELDREIEISEVIKQLKRLKNNKAPGFDLIINELLKNSSKNMVKLITKLFNVIFDSGIVPTDWVNGLIKPLWVVLR